MRGWARGRAAWISLAGPITGALGAAICWVYGEQQGSALLQALGYVGFMLNLFNLTPGRDPRRRLDLARDQDDAARRHAREGERDHGRLLRPRCTAAPRDGRRARPAAPALMSIDRHILERDDVDLDAHVAMIAEEFRMGFEAVDRVPRPAVTVFGSARIRPDSARVRARTCVRPRAGRGRLRGRHRRRPGRDGGREPRREGGRRLLGRLQHRAPARAAGESLHRPGDHVPPLLRAQGRCS